MSQLTIAGGIYREKCVWPAWNQVYGSAGRASCALAGSVDEIILHTYASSETAALFLPLAELDEIVFRPTLAAQNISFEYIHSLSIPIIRPSPTIIKRENSIEVTGDAVLRFGMIEGSAKVHAKKCVYDPQSAFHPEAFEYNGSQAERLAIVANRKEIVALAGGGKEPIPAAQSLLKDNVEVVVVKQGVGGASVVTRKGVLAIPAFQTKHVFTVGSGDVFAAFFASEWAVHDLEPNEAALHASRAVAEYVETMAFPIPPFKDLAQLPEAAAKLGMVYLAGPFFSLGQRWLVDDVRRCLRELGLDVFSPVHDIGSGPAEQVGPADIEALDKCDLVFALLDGMDSGTLFEVGWARAKGKPVYGVAQNASEEDLKMVIGSGCRVFDDLVTALHHAAWRT